MEFLLLQQYLGSAVIRDCERGLPVSQQEENSTFLRKLLYCLQSARGIVAQMKRKTEINKSFRTFQQACISFSLDISPWLALDPREYEVPYLFLINIVISYFSSSIAEIILASVFH